MILCCCELEEDCQNPVVHVNGCFVSDGTLSGGSYLPIAGATVSFVLSGTTYGPWTTDSTGKVVIGVPLAGTATFTITPPGGSHYDTLVVVRSINCYIITYTFNLLASDGYQCGGPSCCNPPTTAEGPPYLISEISYPETIYLNDGLGMITLGPPPTPSVSRWVGCARRMAAKGQKIVNDSYGCHYEPFDNVEVSVYYMVFCGYNPTVNAYGWTISGWLANGTPCPYASCPGGGPFPPRPSELPNCDDPVVCGRLSSTGFISGGCVQFAVSGQAFPGGYGWCAFAPFGDCPPASFAIEGTCSFTNDWPYIAGSGFQLNGTWPGYQIYGSSVSLSVTS